MAQDTARNFLASSPRAHPDHKLYIATKIPPKNRIWPTRRGFKLEDCFPADYIKEYTDKSLHNLGVERISVQQFHVWEDDWAELEEWQRAIEDLKHEGKIEAVGISINRWEPWNALKTLRTGKMDAVQVIYNIFDQNPHDELFPVCDEYNVGVIARVPFDEGSLTGTLAFDSKWADGDWRNGYFVPDNLESQRRSRRGAKARTSRKA